jgi:hypothetical protein
MDGILIKMNLKEKNIILHNLVLAKKMDDTVGYYCYKASIFHFMSTPYGILKIISAKNSIKLIVQKHLIVLH